ncbi:MAG: flagellar hook capping FlgD N-terminal domain-containing protein [Sulfurimonas sp.]|nr:flagellar hook capping FlgD N-terminal domain-containing protein [Sulfurimonas sp.]
MIFLQLLLVQLQYQDPTSPTDSETILTQTSQLAALESAQNTNDALEKLSLSLQTSQEFSIVNSIGKRADLGSDAITHEEGSSTTFEVYFPEDIKSGSVTITDLDGNFVADIPIEMPENADGTTADQLGAGVYQFTWDGLDARGVSQESGIYRVNSEYLDTADQQQTTRLGAYPIESVRFEEGKAFLKLGSSYVALEDIVEVY